MRDRVLVVLSLATALHVMPVEGADADDAAWNTAVADINACFVAMDKDPALAIVNAKYARRDPTPAQLADKSVATDEEADRLRARVAKTRPCREKRLAAVKTFRPLLEPSYRILYYQADQLFQYLSEKWVAYGEANRLSRASLQTFEAREKALGALKSDDAKADLSREWDEMLQRAHSNPPPPNPPAACEWENLNLACKWP